MKLRKEIEDQFNFTGTESYTENGMTYDSLKKLTVYDIIDNQAILLDLLLDFRDLLIAKKAKNK